MANSNLQGQLKLYKISDFQSLNQESLELVADFKDHMFPVNDIAFSPHTSTL